MQRCWFGCRANKGASSEIQVLSDLRLLFPDTHPPCTHVCIHSHRHEYMAIKHSSTIYQRNNMCHMCMYVCMYVRMYKFMYVYIYIYIYDIKLCIYISIYRERDRHVVIYIYICIIYIYIYIYICKYCIYIYIYMCVYYDVLCIYTSYTIHIHTSKHVKINSSAKQRSWPKTDKTKTERSRLKTSLGFQAR